MVKKHKENRHCNGRTLPPEFKWVNVICWTCGKFGHNKCERPKNYLSNYQSYNRYDCCWNCRSKGHHRFACPNPKILFCSFCAKVGKSSFSCSCNELTLQNISKQQYSEEERTLIENTLEKTSTFVTPNLALGTRSLMKKCSLVVDIGGIRYDAVVDSKSAFSRINPLKVDLSESSQVGAEGWAGVNVGFGGETSYLLFALDKYLEDNINFGLDAQIILSFDVTILGRSVHNSRVIPNSVT